MYGGGQFVQQTFSECDTVQVRLIPLNGSTTLNSTGPYYMFEYSPESTTIVSHIGDKPDSLQWQVQHPQGTASPLDSHAPNTQLAPSRLQASTHCR